MNGIVLDSFTYSPYGESGESTTGFPFRFTGQKLDPETGLMYYKARYYSPKTGRFLQTDPIGYEDQMNMYTYVANDPLNNTDPDGREIRVQTHSVFHKRHAYILIIPDDQEAYADDPRFQQTLPDGRRYATLGAGPENTVAGLFEGRSDLVSAPNRPRDADTSERVYDDVEVRAPNAGEEGYNENDTIGALFEADAAYCDCQPYDINPGDGDGYNSNGYVSGILGAVGIEPPELNDAAQGYDVPVPQEEFE